MVIESEIVKWYFKNKRDLPWHGIKNPYEIWVSEVILQQTRVDQAISYYYDFLKAFPDVFKLAAAEEDKILKIWQGLGYYSRARNMHFSAKQIVNEFDGKFPSKYSELLKLKGVGEYTAAAIASFSFNEKVPAIDGNVFRVLSRLFAEESPIDKAESRKIYKKIASELLRTQDSSIFNQAIMEFGAIQCVPRNPDCINCPLNEVCLAYKKSIVNDLPKKIGIVKKKERYFYYFLILNNGNTYIRKREQKDIWQGLFEFPLLESAKSQDFSSICTNQSWKEIFGKSAMDLISESNGIVHKLTHQTIYAKYYVFELSGNSDHQLLKNGFIKIKMEDLVNYPVPKIIENFIKRSEF